MITTNFTVTKKINANVAENTFIGDRFLARNFYTSLLRTLLRCKNIMTGHSCWHTYHVILLFNAADTIHDAGEWRQLSMI